MLGDSIDSLMTNVSDSENVEIMLGIDNDDQETLDFVQSEDGLGGTRVLAPENERQALGFNVMMRSRF